jgi:hypothetical protein
MIMFCVGAVLIGAIATAFAPFALFIVVMAFTTLVGALVACFQAHDWASFAKAGIVFVCAQGGYALGLGFSAVVQRKATRRAFPEEREPHGLTLSSTKEK